MPMSFGPYAKLSKLCEVLKTSWFQSLWSIPAKCKMNVTYCTYVQIKYSLYIKALLAIFSVVVFISNRWRYCQMQPQKIGSKGQILRIFDAKFQLRWFQSENVKYFDFFYHLHSKLNGFKIILVAFCNAI